MPTFTGAMAAQSLNYMNEEVKNGKKAEDLWDFTPYIGNFGEYAKRYGDYIKIYDSSIALEMKVNITISIKYFMSNKEYNFDASIFHDMGNF